MTNFRDLIVWKKAVEFHKDLIPILNQFPIEEVNCMGYSLRKSSLEISSSIANGCGRGSNQNLKYFLFIALGNIKQVQSLLILSKELKYLEEGNFNLMENKIIDIERMILGLIDRVN